MEITVLFELIATVLGGFLIVTLVIGFVFGLWELKEETKQDRK